MSREVTNWIGTIDYTQVCTKYVHKLRPYFYTIFKIVSNKHGRNKNQIGHSVTVRASNKIGTINVTYTARNSAGDAFMI